MLSRGVEAEMKDANCAQEPQILAKANQVYKTLRVKSS